jgi:hypothetical protein
VRTTTPYMTKYERARIIGARALQISMNAPVMVGAPFLSCSRDMGHHPSLWADAIVGFGWHVGCAKDTAQEDTARSVLVAIDDSSCLLALHE